MASPGKTLFLCWPPYDEPMARECLANYRGDVFVFVGEHHGGCTGDEKFFEVLEAEWEVEQEIDLPQWDGLHDYMTVYRRKH